MAVNEPDMVSMERTSEDRQKSSYGMPMPSSDMPYGLCISLTEVEIEKLGLEGDCSVGDMIEFCAVAKVTAVSSTDSEENGKHCRVELQITHMGIDDDEADESPEEEAAEGDD